MDGDGTREAAAELAATAAAEAAAAARACRDVLLGECNLAAASALEASATSAASRWSRGERERTRLRGWLDEAPPPPPLPAPAAVGAVAEECCEVEATERLLERDEYSCGAMLASVLVLCTGLMYVESAAAAAG